MTGGELLEALNPVAEFRGNPGAPVRPSVTRRRSRPLTVAAVALAAGVIIVGGLVVGSSQPTGEEQVDLGVGGEPTTATPSEPTASPVPVPTQDPSVEVMPPFLASNEPAPDEHEVVARLTIPAINSDVIVVDGVSIQALRSGPGHYPLSPLPGQSGNSALAGHRTTYGAPFHRIDELERRDQIFVTTLQGTFEYLVTETSIVGVNDLSVLEDFGDNRLTLTSSHPKYTQLERIVVVAELVGRPAPSIEFDQLPVLAQVTDGDISGAPYISDTSFQNVDQPYLSFVGSPNALDTARTFIDTQFPDWGTQLTLEVHQQTERAASIRWVDERGRLAGWIVLFFGDGVFHVFDMTTDGFEVDFFTTAVGARAIARSTRPMTVEVLRPLPHSMTSGMEVGGRSPLAGVALTTVRIDNDALGQDQHFGFDSERSGDVNFQEVRIVLRDETGEQVGAAISGLTS